MKIVTGITLLLLFAATYLPAQNRQADQRTYRQNAMAAYRNQDYRGFLENTRKALELNPTSPTMRYNLACALALTDQPDSALAVLMGLAKQGIDFGAAQDGDFASLRDRKEFKEILAMWHSKFSPVNRSRIAFTIDQYDFMPEGMAYDPRSKRFFIGSGRYARVMAVDSLGHTYEFGHLDHDGPVGAFGMTVDTIRNRLWVVGTASNWQKGYTDEQRGNTAAFGLDLETGETRDIYTFPGGHPDFGINDLTVVKSGDIYVTASSVYKFTPGNPLPEEIVPIDVAYGTNGIAVTPDDHWLFVGDYPTGVLAVDLTTDTYHWITCPDTLTLAGIDGLYFYENSLVAIQNVMDPWQAIRFFLNDTYTAVDSAKILERGNPDVVEAFTGAIVNDSLYYVGIGPIPDGIPEGYYTPAQHRQLGRVFVLKTKL